MSERDPYRPGFLRRQWNRMNRRAAYRYYPRSDGGVVLVGPECFASIDAAVICWMGVNYYRRDDAEDGVA
jgi:hypothetical protein